MYDINIASEVLTAVAAFVGIGIAVILFLAGPLGWVLLVGLCGAVVIVRIMVGGGSDRSTDRSPSDRVNCPGCGARIPSTESTCEHCGEEL